MVLAVRVPLAQAQETLEELSRQDVIDEAYLPKREDRYFYIAVTEKPGGYETIEHALAEKPQHTTLREALREELEPKELSRLKTAYDVVGEIAVLEIDEELRDKETIIAQTLLETAPNISTVVRKDGAHEGELRLQQYKVLAGKNTLETTHTENGVSLFLDISKTYYSPRSATERKRIAGLVAPKERVLVMFSGCGPFVAVLGKNTEAAEVVGVELNEDAHTYAQKNIEQNKLTNCSVLQGDVRDVVPKLGAFDRILMPLPHTAKDFLDVAVPATKKDGMIHLYHFSSEEDVQEFAQTIPDRIKELGATSRVEHIQRCGNLGPGQHRWCLDIRIEDTK